MRIDRMLGIIVLLLNKDTISAKKLSERFEVSVRTIYRDIESICMAGIPVITYPGSKGGFGIMENYKLDRQVLTIDDMASIISALKGVNASTGIDDLDNIAEKILNIVPHEKMEQVKKYSEEFIIELVPWGFRQKYKDYIKILQHAISNRYIIEFLYNNTRNETLLRLIEPMTLVFKGYAWYLFGFCRNKNDFRLFRLNRIDKLKLTSQTFVRRDQTYQDFMKVSSEAVSSVKTVLKFSPNVKMRVEEYFEQNSITYLEDGYLQVTLFYPEDEWSYANILSFGESVEVIEPAHLRKIISDKAKRIFEHYKTDMQLSTTN